QPADSRTAARPESERPQPDIASDKNEDRKPPPGGEPGGTQTAEKDPIKQELDKLAGRWQLLALMVNGQNLLAKEEPRERPMVIKDGKLSNEGEGKNRLEAMLKVHPNPQLCQIDFIFTTGEVRGKITAGIHKLEGDFLTICTNEENR